PYTALDSFLITKAHDLFKQLYAKRMLLRLIGVKLSHLVSGFEQIGLYHTSEEEYDLYQAMDKVRNHYGIESVVKACIVKGPERDENGKVIKYNPRKNKIKNHKEGETDNTEERKKSRIRTFINAELGTATKLD
ncbi:MAG: DNA polymerase IV, partial [Chryseobacterium sp.]